MYRRKEIPAAIKYAVDRQNLGTAYMVDHLIQKSFLYSAVELNDDLKEAGVEKSVWLKLVETAKNSKEDIPSYKMED